MGAGVTPMAESAKGGWRCQGGMWGLKRRVCGRELVKWRKGEDVDLASKVELEEQPGGEV